jgi:hypothetical protein
MPDLFTPIELFREAVSFTHQRVGFPERLIEKDYVCTIILEFLTAAHPDLVFKGGTCLAKIYANFYRMSEDLDFVIPMPIDAPRWPEAHGHENSFRLSPRYRRRFLLRT